MRRWQRDLQVTEIEVSYVEFPSITICNLQPVSASTSAIMNSDPRTKLHQWNNATRDYFEHLDAQNESTTHEYDMMYDRMRGPRGFFENIGIAEASVIGHQAHDFIIHCTFSKALCSADNFSWFASADFYNCYTFNGVDLAVAGDVNGTLDGDAGGGRQQRQPLIASSTGPESGLSLTLYLENDDGSPSEHDASYYAFQNTGNAVGVRVTVHAPRTRPNPVDSGFDVPPGYSSSVGLSVTQYRRLGLPFGECVSEQQQAEYNDR
jgi:Amiloride-sensitive sodium channel